jgi:hypothetical protein
MRQDFRDYFGFAILGNVWNVNDVSTCGDACSGDYDKCCFNVYMTDRNTNATNNENYCMIEDAATDEFAIQMMNFEVKMKCDKDTMNQIKKVPALDEFLFGNSASRIAGVLASAAFLSTLF